MRLNLTAAPAAEPVSLDEAKSHLKVDGADENALIGGLIQAAREYVESSTRRALITQTWEMVLDEAADEISIPKPPLQEVTKIEVIAADGTKTIVSSSLYDVEISLSSRGRIRLKAGSSWPTHRGFASFIVTFKAGYGDAAADVPQMLRQAVLQVLGHIYENRQSEEMPAGVFALMAPYRVYRL